MAMEAMQDNEGIVIRVSLKSIYSEPWLECVRLFVSAYGFVPGS